MNCLDCADGACMAAQESHRILEGFCKEEWGKTRTERFFIGYQKLIIAKGGVTKYWPCRVPKPLLRTLLLYCYFETARDRNNGDLLLEIRSSFYSFSYSQKPGVRKHLHATV